MLKYVKVSNPGEKMGKKDKKCQLPVFMRKILEMIEIFCLILTKNLTGFSPKNRVFGQALFMLNFALIRKEKKESSN